MRDPNLDRSSFDRLRAKGCKVVTVSHESRKSHSEVAAELAPFGFSSDQIGIGAQLAA
jgi:hypothetical protein